MDSKSAPKAHQDLVFDVGMHKGEDTCYYLKKGFRVVGFEADPDLIEHCKKRFSEAIERRRLVIVEGAIVRRKSEEAGVRTVRFYKNLGHSVWGTVNDTWADRNEKLGTHSRVIEVRAIDFTKCLDEYGIPYYMKIDIEGTDTVCLESLLGFDLKPSYVSIEAEKMVFDRLREEVNLLERLGYNAFKAVQQQNIMWQVEPVSSRHGPYAGHEFEPGSSGLFGEDAPGKWKNAGQILRGYRIIFFLYGLFGDYGRLNKFAAGKQLRWVLERALRRSIPGWYDTHARHSSVTA